MHANRTQNQINRREFGLAAGAGFAGSLLGTRRLPAATADVDCSFIVISDTHVGYKGAETAARLWKQTAADLKDAPGEFILHLGDIVDGGRAEQYPIYKATRDTIGKPVFEIPGNHDPLPLFNEHLRKETDVAIDRHGLRFLLVGNAHTDSHDGFFTTDQISWLAAQCDEAAKRDLCVILAAHVPVHTNQHPDRGWYVKPTAGQAEIYALAERHKHRLVAFFHGHFHNGLRGWDDHGPLHEMAFPSALYNQDRQLTAKQAPGYNLDEFRPGYVLASIRAGVMTLRLNPLDADLSATKQFDLGRADG